MKKDIYSTAIKENLSLKIEGDRSFIYFMLFALKLWLENTLYCTCYSLNYFLYFPFWWMLSVQSHDYTHTQTHTYAKLISVLHYPASIPNRENQRKCMVNFSICTRACVTNAAASEKQRMLSPCPSIANSFCAAASEVEFCSAQIGLIAVYAQQHTPSASLD